MDKIAFFLPTRKGSERVKDKNTRPFAHINGGLIENKLQQLTASKRIDEIILSTNDEICINIASKYISDRRLRIIPRPESLCLSSTNLQDLIRYVPTITEAEHILWGHVTTPICGAEVYDRAIDVYFSMLKKGYDSLVSVVELKNFLLNKQGKLINNTTPLLWPRTQDLFPLYEINHAMFIASKEIYVTTGNRIGKNPFLYLMNKLQSFDIDWEEDFAIAEMIFERNRL